LPVFEQRVKEGKVFFCFGTSHEISQMFRRAVQRCHISGTFHDLRKTHSTDLYDAGMNKSDIQSLLGHSDIKVTDNHYLKTTITRIVRQARKIERSK
jgi:integrase